MTLTPFAQLHPMPRSFEATLSIAELWRACFVVFAASSERDALVRELTGYDPAKFSEHRQSSLTDVAISVLLQTAIRDERLEVFVSDGQRFFRLPADALHSPFDSIMGDGDPTFLARHSVELSFSTGTLSSIDTAPEHRWIADSKLPLLITETHQRDVVRWVAEMVRSGPSAGGATLMPSPETQQRWIEEQLAQPRWPFAVFAFWVALRDLGPIATQFLLWAGSEADPLKNGSGFILGWAVSMGDHVTLVEPAPATAIERALANGAVRASGYFEGVGARQEISPEQWDGLELADAPSPFGHLACALKRGRIIGGRLEGFWTDLRFQRASLLEAFPPIGMDAIADAGADNSSRVSATWRIGPGERQQSWVFRGDVIAEAERRLAEGITDKKSINGVLAEMARECGVSWPQASIASTRRR